MFGRDCIIEGAWEKRDLKTGGPGMIRNVTGPGRIVRRYPPACSLAAFQNGELRPQPIGQAAPLRRRWGLRSTSRFPMRYMWRCSKRTPVFAVNRRYGNNRQEQYLVFNLFRLMAASRHRHGRWHYVRGDIGRPHRRDSHTSSPALSTGPSWRIGLHPVHRLPGWPD
jgi:hypothetical protein